MNGISFRILIVEDDADDRFIIDEAFKEIKYEVNVKKFIDGDALMSYLEKIDQPAYPSLIILDNALPRQDAADILTKLKSTEPYQSIKVIIYTTLVSPSRRQQLLSLGAYACMEKGRDMREVVAIAEQLKALAEAS